MSESWKNILRLTELVSVNEQTGLSLGQYIDLVAEVPLPTQQQKHDFAIYVSHAHSWYKHLPAYPPGVPFCFFIDKYAGCDRVLQQEGTLKIAEREKTGFHYADIPTERYRNRFGYLAFACGAGTTVVHRGEGPIVVPRDKIPGALHNDAVMYGLPKEIMEAGTIHLTAVIHALSASYLIWDPSGRMRADQIPWPEESGGQISLVKIIDRCRERGAGKGRLPQLFLGMDPDLAIAYPFSVDPILHALLRPERRRQRAEMLKPIDRVCEVISSHRSSYDKTRSGSGVKSEEL